MSRKRKPGDRLELIAPDKRKHLEPILELTGKCFGHYYEWIRYGRLGYIGSTHYDWDASRIGLIDGRVVTHWGVWGYTMRIGRARVRVGGIGAVATDGEFRKFGLMARTARAIALAMFTSEVPRFTLNATR